MSRLLERLALASAAIVAAIAAVWGWLRAIAIKRQLDSERSRRASAEVAAAQADAAAEAARAREAAEAGLLETVSTINAEVPRVDTHDDLAGAFDRASGRTIGPEDDTPTR